jgi:hypothetical protein
MISILAMHDACHCYSFSKAPKFAVLNTKISGIYIPLNGACTNRFPLRIPLLNKKSYAQHSH